MDATRNGPAEAGGAKAERPEAGERGETAGNAERRTDRTAESVDRPTDRTAGSADERTEETAGLSTADGSASVRRDPASPEQAIPPPPKAAPLQDQSGPPSPQVGVQGPEAPGEESPERARSPLWPPEAKEPQATTSSRAASAKRPANPSEKSAGAPRRFVRFLRRVLAAFLADRCLLLASSLSYATVLSVVPFLAVAFSVAKGLGLYQTDAVRDILLRLAAGREQVVDNVLGYVDRTNVQTLGVIGALVLLFTAVSLLETIEGAMNIIWNAPARKKLLQKYSGFLALIIVCPMLVLAAVSLTGALQSQEVVRRLLELRVLGELYRALLTVLPWLLVVAALFALYAFLPNAPVRPASALVGAASAGLLWQLLQWAYVRYQFGAAGYNAIYGGFAQIPLLLVWLYASWAVVMFGAEITHAFQMRRTYRQELAAKGYSQADRRRLAVLVLLLLTKNFERREVPTANEEIARLFDAPARLVDEILRVFSARRTVIRVGEDKAKETYMLARPPEQVTLVDVAAALDESRGEGVEDVPFEREYPVAGAVHERYLAPSAEAAETTFLDLYRRHGQELDDLVREKKARLEAEEKGGASR